MSRKPETVEFWRGRLPHWEVAEGRYFVTIHLAGAIPRQGQDRIHHLAAEYERLAQNDLGGRLKVQRQIFAEMERWLDQAERATHLRNGDVARIVMEAIAHRQGTVWNLFEYVIMPNHIHLFFELLRSGLKQHLEQFKRWTGHETGKLLNLDKTGFWQDEWFDHWSRSDEEDSEIAEYIRRNPEKAGLVAHYTQWPFGSWSR
jgi:REP element-mobilizing transposase RayT